MRSLISLVYSILCLIVFHNDIIRAFTDDGEIICTNITISYDMQWMREISDSKMISLFTRQGHLRFLFTHYYTGIYEFVTCS